MPLDQAVLDHQVVSKEASAEGGERHMDVVAVAARRDMVNGLVAALRKAGLRPAGDRPLRLRHDPRSDRRASPSPSRAPSSRRPSTATSATSPTSRSPAARSASSPASPPTGIENMAARVAESRADAAARTPASGSSRSASTSPLDDFGDDRDEAESARQALHEGASRLADELRVSLEFYGAQEGAPPIDRIVACGPASMIPGLPERIQTSLGRPIELESPPALSTDGRRGRRAADRLLRTGAGRLTCAPST